MKHFIVVAIAAALLVVAPVASASAASSSIIVNRQPLSTDQVQVLEWYYGVTIQPGAYWYDPISGLWGSEGGPSNGQLAPGLPLGGPLRSDASNGHTGVFFNNRQLTDSEVAYLRTLFGAAPPGHYWLDANGTGGPEGSSASFSLTQASQSSATNYAGTTNRNAFGAYGSDGSCYYVSVEGGDVLGPGC
jgi:hypothetical protein